MFKFRYDMTDGKLRRGSRRVAGVGKGRSKWRQAKTARTRRKSVYGTGGTGGSLGGGAPYPAGGGGLQRYSPVYERAEASTVAEDFLPTDTATQNKIFRKIIMFDPIAGPATDYWRDLTFSDRLLTSGIKDKKLTQFYNDAIEASGIAGKMPDMLASYLTFGRMVGHQLMDEKKGYWTETILHDLDRVSITRVPFPNEAPIIDYEPSEEERAFASSKDPRAREIMKKYDQKLIKMMAAGKPIPLDPDSTLFLARKAYATDYYGTSYLTRILPFWIYEKALIDATVAGARRRAGPVRYANVPEDYTAGEMDMLLDQFFAAEEDPIGGLVLMREGVTLNELGSGRDQIWKMSDEWDFLSSAKMRALGISESLLSGEANWNSLEMIVSVFLEKVRAMRRYFTQKLVVEDMLVTLARRHKYYKRTEAELAHGIRIAKKDVTVDDLHIPKVEWDRPLEPVGDEVFMDILDKLEEKGLPVPMRMMSQASGFDIDKALESFEADLETQEKVLQYRLAQIKQNEQYGFDADGNYTGESGGEEEGGEFGGGGLETFEEEFGLPGGEEEEGGGFPEGGEEEEAPGGGGAEEAPPAAPEEGFGADLAASRFSVPSSRRPKKMITALGNGEGDLIKKLEAFPIWDSREMFFDLPARKVAKLLHEIGSTNPDSGERARLAKTLPRKWKKEGLTDIQRQVLAYLSMRLGYIPIVRLQPQIYTYLKRWMTERMEQSGLTGAITQEFYALSRLSGMDSPRKKKIESPSFMKRYQNRAENRLSENQILTGVID